MDYQSTPPNQDQSQTTNIPLPPDIPPQPKNSLFKLLPIVIVVTIFSIGGIYLALKIRRGQNTNNNLVPLPLSAPTKQNFPTQSSSSQTTDQTTDWNTYISTEKGFSVMYPGNWAYEEHVTKSGADFIAENGEAAVSVQFFYKTDSDLVDLKEYVEQGAIKEFPNWQELKTMEEVKTNDDVIGYKVT